MKFEFNINISQQLQKQITDKINELLISSSQFEELYNHIQQISFYDILPSVNPQIEPLGNCQYCYDVDTDSIYFKLNFSLKVINMFGDCKEFDNIITHEFYHCIDKLNYIYQFNYKNILVSSILNIYQDILHYQLVLTLNLWSEYYAYRNTCVEEKYDDSRLDSILKNIGYCMSYLQNNTNFDGTIENKQIIYDVIEKHAFYNNLYEIVRLFANYDKGNKNINIRPICEVYLLNWINYIHQTLIDIYSSNWGEDFTEYMIKLTQIFFDIFRHNGLSMKILDNKP